MTLCSNTPALMVVQHNLCHAGFISSTVAPTILNNTSSRVRGGICCYLYQGSLNLVSLNWSGMLAEPLYAYNVIIRNRPLSKTRLRTTSPTNKLEPSGATHSQVGLFCSVCKCQHASNSLPTPLGGSKK